MKTTFIILIISSILCAGFIAGRGAMQQQIQIKAAEQEIINAIK